MKQQLIVHLRVYRGKTLAYNAQGEITSENNLVHLTHDTAEWHRYLKHLRSNGFLKVEVESILDLNVENKGKEKSDPDFYGSVEKDSKIFQSVVKEVTKALNPISEVPLTEDQKRIKELTERLEALEGGKKDEGAAAEKDLKVAGNKKENAAKKEVDPLLNEARDKYFKVFGKKGMPTWDVEEINKRIEEKLNAK